jgi:thiol:disulfide interchange protein
MGTTAADLPGDFTDEQDPTVNGEAEAAAADLEIDESAPAVDPGELTVQAPEGAEFVMSPVNAKRGTQSLGEVPILTWRNLDAARRHYGDEKILDSLDGTSLRVAFQAIARRGRASGKLTFNQIAEAQVKYQPGSRTVAASTPVSEARKAAEKAAQKVGAESASKLTALLNKINSGEIDVNDPSLAALFGNGE